MFSITHKLGQLIFVIVYMDVCDLLITFIIIITIILPSK